MATQSLTYTTNTWLPIAPGCCQLVAICVAEGAVEKLANPALPVIVAQAQNTGRYLGSAGMPFPPSFQRPRCEGEFQYTFTIDTDQLVAEAVFECGDIAGISTDICLFSVFAAIVTDLQEQITACCDQ